VKIIDIVLMMMIISISVWFVNSSIGGVFTDINGKSTTLFNNMTYSMSTCSHITENATSGQWNFTDPNCIEQKIANHVRTKAYAKAGAEANQLNFVWASGDFFFAISMLVDLFGDGVIRVDETLRNVQIPDQQVIFWTIIIYIMYVIGLIQFIGNRSFEGMT
jgi:hypothetical protein